MLRLKPAISCVACVLTIVFICCTEMQAQNSGGSWEHVPGLNGSVDAIAVGGRDLYVGGTFIDAGGNPNGDGIVKWNGSSWEALGAGLHHPFGSWIHAIEVSGNDVYVGGLFTDAGGNPDADYLAKWNGSAWDTVGTRLNNEVFTIAIQDTNIYVGGFFTNAGGNYDADRIARWNGHRWQALGEGLNHYVWTIAIHNGDIYAGGRFTDAGGDTSADYIARWNSSDSTWEAVGNGLGITPRWELSVDHIGFLGDELYIGGRFVNAGGDPTANLIARLNGNRWEGLGPGLSQHPWNTTGDPGWVAEFAWRGNDLYVAGLFGGVGSDDSTYNNVAKWNGSAWERLGCGLDLTARTLGISETDVYFGGSFEFDCQGYYPGQYLAWLAKWREETPTAITGDSHPAISDFRLLQNYPNPFNPETTITYTLPQNAEVKISIFNALGQQVRTFHRGVQPAGHYQVQWDGRDNAGGQVSSGVYVYQMVAGAFREVRKMLLLR